MSVDAINPNQSLGDDPQKTEAQRMATDLQTLENLFTDLKNNPALADEPMFWSQICDAVSAIGTEYNYLLNTGVIPLATLSKMFGSFNIDVLGLRTDPSSDKTFESICNEAKDGQTADLHQFLDSLKGQPGVMSILIQDTTDTQKSFEEYANTH